ncbi:hypothetical protein [Aliikangiella sp. IMCC44359]|uniref:hypothetical protein n=1 Tax=Aliikangiella sp. IMCC44359 TaxID=3459125 RepID=UPI00403AC5DD
MSNHFSLLPELDNQSNDWAFVSESNNGEKVLTLVFSVKRDFLSVPKTYQVVTFKGNNHCPLECHQLERQDYMEEVDVEGLINTFGWVQLDSTEGAEIILMLTQSDALEIAFAECCLETTIYHSQNAKAALYEFLTQ